MNFTTQREIRETAGQKKKHVTQFTAVERHDLEKVIRKVLRKWLRTGIATTKHLKNKVINHETQFSYRLTMETMLNHEIIEYNVTGSDRRVVLRSKTPHSFITPYTSDTTGNLGVQCIVISLNSGKVVTSYINLLEDDHKTLDTRRYDKNLKINLENVLTR